MKKFFDEYCAFMKKYKESNNASSMLADYTKYMAQYADMMAKLDAVDENELSSEEALLLCRSFQQNIFKTIRGCSVIEKQKYLTEML